MTILSISLYLALFLFSASIDRICCTTCYRQIRTSYHVQCGEWWTLRQCTKYRYNQEAYCCPGWTGSGCGYAICDGKTNLDGTCNRNEGYVKESSSGPERRNSGGTCYAPEKCTNCNKGYYADGPYCRACLSIANCYYTTCTRRYTNRRCHYCHRVVRDDSTQYGWWAFTRWTDGGLSCKHACSWRAGSRCYPGNCNDTTTASCKCAPGFCYTGI